MDKGEIREYKIQRGIKAKELIKNETLVDCIDYIANNLFIQFQATEAMEEKTREMLWAKTQALGLFSATLETFKSEGEMEERNRKYDDNREKEHARSGTE